MTDQTLVEKAHRILVEEFELTEDALKAEAGLYTDLGLDSLDTVDLMVALEKDFDFKVNRAQDEERIREMRVLRDLYSFVRDKLECAARTP